ncbi:MAG: hypothetical protein AB1457_08950 [Chloroflexota bacterium]
MQKIVLRILLLFLVLIPLSPVTNPVAASSYAQQPPPGFYPLAEAAAVTLYRKEYPGGTPDYVLVVNLAQHAALQVLTGKTAADDDSGTEAAFTPQPMDTFWEQFANNQDAFCVIGGPYFPNAPFNDRLGLKSDGVLRRAGASSGESLPALLMLEVWNDAARISPYTETAFQQSTAGVVIVGLSPQENRQSQAFISRSLAGVQDRDGDGTYESVLFFASKTTRQADAIEVLRSFGANEVLLLADGEAAQINCQGVPYVFAEGRLPAALGIAAGFIADYESTLVRHSEWPVAAEGESVKVEIVVRNNGSQVWQPGEVYLANLRNDWGVGSRLEINTPVAPGQTTVFSFTSQPFERPGVYTSQWAVQREGRNISTRPILVNAVILPEELAARKQELEAQIHEWARQKLENIEELILNWIESQIRRGFDRICPSAALLPGFALLAGWVNSRLSRSQKENGYEKHTFRSR